MVTSLPDRDRRRTRPVATTVVIALAALAVGLLTLSATPEPRDPLTRAPKPDTAARITWSTVASGLKHPWSVAFLPDGAMLVTERPGRLRLVSPEGEISAPIAGLPPVTTGDQAGLLDVVLDPSFGTNRLIYWSYSEPRGGESSATAVARGRLSEDRTRLENVEVIFRQQPAVVSFGHYGSRLVFSRDGTLFVTLGERQIVREMIQDLSTDIGKIVRINPDGSVPADNPFVGQPGKRPEIWSYGHRNPQGATLNPATGELWTAEHGAKGGDEVNIPRKGRNYGWPVISYGVEYSGERIGEGTKKEGMEQPLYYWAPSIAPSGMTFVTSDRYPGMKGNLLVGGLAAQDLSRLVLDGEAVVAEERLLSSLGKRIRDVRQGPDGYLYVLTDEDDGQLLRLEPAN